MRCCYLMDDEVISIVRRLCASVKEMHCNAHFAFFVCKTDSQLALITGNALQPFQNISTSSRLSAPNFFFFFHSILGYERFIWFWGVDACHWAGVMWQTSARVFYSLLQNSIKGKGWLIKCQPVVLWKHQWCHNVTIYAPAHSHL